MVVVVNMPLSQVVGRASMTVDPLALRRLSCCYRWSGHQVVVALLWVTLIWAKQVEEEEEEEEEVRYTYLTCTFSLSLHIFWRNPINKPSQDALFLS